MTHRIRLATNLDHEILVTCSEGDLDLNLSEHDTNEGDHLATLAAIARQHRADVGDTSLVYDALERAIADEFEATDAGGILDEWVVALEVYEGHTTRVEVVTSRDLSGPHARGILHDAIGVTMKGDAR